MLLKEERVRNAKALHEWLCTLGSTEIAQRNTIRRRGTLVYFVGAATRVKIGRSQKLEDRLSCLASSNPEPITLLGVYWGKRGMEKHLHGLFAKHQFPHEFTVTTHTDIASGFVRWVRAQGADFRTRGAPPLIVAENGMYQVWKLRPGKHTNTRYVLVHLTQKDEKVHNLFTARPLYQCTPGQFWKKAIEQLLGLIPEEEQSDV